MPAVLPYRRSVSLVIYLSIALMIGATAQLRIDQQIWQITVAERFNLIELVKARAVVIATQLTLCQQGNTFACQRHLSNSELNLAAQRLIIRKLTIPERSPLTAAIIGVEHAKFYDPQGSI